MNATALAAAKAYVKAAQFSGPKIAPDAMPALGGDFAGLLKQSVDSVAQTGRATDATMSAAAKGQGDMLGVVTAIAETELALETLVSVRDRVISAYQEIMNMPL